MKVLYSGDNKGGKFLEVLLSEIIDDILEKTGRVIHDPDPAAQAVATNNRQIIALLQDARTLQLRTLHELQKSHGPNDPPTPRVGVGSPGYEGRRLDGGQAS